jgi:hypothetical protein
VAVGGLTPFECFVAGVAVAILGLAVLWFLARRSLAKHRLSLTDSLTVVEDAMGAKEHTITSLHRRLQVIEKRLSDLEEQMGRQVMS